jgi:hypothetical protein
MNCLLAKARREFRHVLRDPYVLGGVLVGTVLMLMENYQIPAEMAAAVASLATLLPPSLSSENGNGVRWNNSS